MRCGNCGHKPMVMKDAKGRKFPYKAYEGVELKVSCELLTCEKCGEIGLKASDCQRLDKAIEESIYISENEFTKNLRKRGLDW
jgi:hypothetical protein